MKNLFRSNRLMTKRNFCLALLLCLVTAIGVYVSIDDASAQANKAKTKQTVGRNSARTKAKPSRQTKSNQPTQTGEVENLKENLDSFLSWLGQKSLPPKESVGQTAEEPAVAGSEIPTPRKPGSKRADEPDKAMQYHLQKRLPEGETELPLERYVEAMEQMQQMPVHSTADNRWMSQQELRTASPEQQRLGTWTWLGPGNIGGRTRTIVFNPQNPSVVYAGGVSGGVWKSTDGGTTWTAISDLIANLPVSALALEPNNPNVIYAGTGEGFEIGSQNGVNITGGHRGLGIYKSTDGGANWTRLPGTNTSDFYYVNDLVVSTANPMRVYAATGTGVWRSLDGGATWTQAHNPNLRGGCLDLAIRTDQPNDTVFASCGTRVQASIFRNTDAGGAGAWSMVHTDTNMGRTVLAIAPSNQNVIYALSTAYTGTFTNSLHAVFRSTTGGESGSWTARVRNTDPNKLNRSILSIPALVTAIDCRISTADSISGQGFYDLALAVDPVDENRVWAGGIDVARSDDGGANWGIAGFAYEYIGSALSYGKADQLHPDQHFLIFHPQYNGTTNQQMFVGNDGGIWRTDNARATVATGPTGACKSSNSAVRFKPLNNSYSVTQFYHGAVSPDGKTYLGGTQDNGTPLGNDTDGPNKWRQVVLADGGYAAIDHRNPSAMYASTQQAGFRRSTDGGATFSTATLGLGLTGGLFIVPLAMDPSDPLRIYVGGTSIWRTDTGMATWTSLGTLGSVSQTSGVMSAVAVSPTDANFVMWGMSDGSLVRTNRALSLNAGNLLSTTDLARQPRTGFVSWVAFDPNDKNTAYATYSTFGGSHVWKTTNGGDSWSSIDGTGAMAFPDIPAHCIVVDPSNISRLYVGTDLGVFVTTDGGASWGVENTGFANALTESLALNTVGGVTSLYAFTHGRGAFRVTANMTGCNFSLGETGKSVEAGGSDLTVAVNVAPGGCNWQAQSNATWIVLQPNTGGSASGTASMKVTANPGFTSRIGTVTIAGRSFTVTQAGQTDTESPKILITNPATTVVNTTQPIINISGTVTENNRLASLIFRSNIGTTGTVSFTTTGTWSAASLPLSTGANVFTFVATDASGNVSSATLTVNARPDSLLVTAAGSGVTTFDRDNVPATLAGMSRPWRVSFDSAGNMYIADDAGNRVRKVAPNGIITTVAGTGVSGFAGDGGPATSARLQLPSHAVVDKDGNLYIADYSNFRVRKVTAATGIISTFAGNGVEGFSGDGGQATAAQLGVVESVGFGKDGNLYIADTGNNRIRKVDVTTGVISTVAGNGLTGFSGDGGNATAAAIGGPVDLAFDSAGDLYIVSFGANRIRKVTLSSGVIFTVAGNGTGTFNGDGQTALNTAFNGPFGIAIDSANNLFITDRGNFRVRKVNASDQIVSTLAGGASGFSPDGFGAIGARLGSPTGLAFDPAGRLFFCDTANARVRTILNALTTDTVAPTVQITAPTNMPTFTATDNPLGLSGSAADNGAIVLVRWSNDRGGSGQAAGTTSWAIPSISLQRGVNNLTVTAWDSNGNANSAQLAVTYSPAQVMVTIAGTGVLDNTGDGGPGSAATFNQPRGVAVDSKGNIIVADTQNRRVRRVSPAGQISAFAGTGLIGSGGDGGQAVDGTVNFPNVVITDKSDNVYISDQLANRIRKVTPDGKISTIAGNGEGFGVFGGYSGDGVPATQALLNQQVGIAVDNGGNLFIADRLNNRIRRVDAATNIITTVAGTGFTGSAGDGGAATQAELNAPTGVAVDAAGNVYIADAGNQRIRKVTAADGKISTIAGDGTAGFSGDDGPATAARINLSYPATMAIDAMGDLYFADRSNHRIRKIVLGTNVITTVVGTGFSGFNGDGTAPLATTLSFPCSVAFDSAGNLIIADTGNQRIRRVRLASALQTVSSVSAASFSTTAGLAAEEIAVAFGTNLAASTVSATTIPLPTALAGTTVKVRDNLGAERLAPLFFVSATQINFLVPSGTANGLATVTVTNSMGEISTGLVAISNVAPSLFSANATGTGLAAAGVFRRTAAGVDSYEPMVRFDSTTNRFVAVPIDLGPEGDQVFLIPYGTGLRGLSGLSGFSATVGGVNAPAFFVGATPGFFGLDQANIRLDRSLIGKGEVDVVMTADGKTTNTVRVAIK